MKTLALRSKFWHGCWITVLAWSAISCAAAYEDGTEDFEEEELETASITQAQLAADCKNEAAAVGQTTEFATCSQPTMWKFPIRYEKVPGGVTKDLQDAMDAWKSVTNGMVWFKEDSTYTPRVKFVTPDTNGKLTPGDTSDDGFCSSFQGRITDQVQVVKLLGCGGWNAQHELGHLLGFMHEHIRGDRNRYVSINEPVFCQDADNTGKCAPEIPLCITSLQFMDSVRYCGGGSTVAQGLIGPYDYTSVMSYGSVPLHPPGEVCTAADTSGCDLVTRTTPPQLVPGGNVNDLDGSKLIELINVNNGWKVFEPIYRSTTQSGAPLDTRLISNVGVTQSPALARWKTSDLIVLARGDDNHIYWKENPAADMSWPSGNWEDLGGDFRTSPAAVSWGANRLDVVGVSTGNRVYHKWYENGVWRASWKLLDRPPGTGDLSAPAIASWGANHLDIFVRADKKLYQRSWTSAGWSAGWVERGCCVNIQGDPAAVSWGPNRIDVVAMKDGSTEMIHLPYDSGWKTWGSIGGSFAPNTSPAITSRGVDKLDIFGISGKGRVYHKSWNAGWVDWTNIGGKPVAKTSPAAYAASNGRIHVAVNINNGKYAGIWHRYHE